MNNQGLLSFFKPSLRPQTLLLRSLLLLPVLLVIWYSLAEVVTRPAIELSGWLLTWGFPNLIQSVGVNDFYMVSLTSLGADTQQALPTGLAVFSRDFFLSGQHYPFLLQIPVNALQYGYGLPLFIALTLAHPQSYTRVLRVLGSGFLLVTLVQTWGICFDTLQFCLRISIPELAEQVKQQAPFLTIPLVREGIGFAYKIGFLIFPVILPLALWAYYSAESLKQLVYGSAASRSLG